jgi:hypothetical protein
VLTTPGYNLTRIGTPRQIRVHGTSEAKKREKAPKAGQNRLGNSGNFKLRTTQIENQSARARRSSWIGSISAAG